MQSNSVIFTVKEQPMKLELIETFPKKNVIRAVTAWPSCFIGWWEPDIDQLSLDLRNAGRSRRLWEWEGAHFDTRKLYLEVGPSYADIIAKLAAGFIIYPDGTYNPDFFHYYQKLKGATNGKH